MKTTEFKIHFLIIGCLAYANGAFSLLHPHRFTSAQTPSLAYRTSSRTISRNTDPTEIRLVGRSPKLSDLRASTVPSNYLKPSLKGRLKDNFKHLLQRFRSDEVLQWRSAASVFLLTIASLRHVLDARLRQLWTYLSTSQHILAVCFRHDHWEWILAVVCFFVYIHGFLLADRAVLRASKLGKEHPFRKYRLQDRFLAQKHAQNLSKRKEAGEEVDVNEPPPFVTVHSPWHFGGYFLEVRALILWTESSAWPLCPNVSSASFSCGSIWLLFSFGTGLIHEGLERSPSWLRQPPSKFVVM